MRLTYLVTAAAVLAVLSGCQRTTFGGFPGQNNNNTQLIQPAPISPAPVGGVESSQLPDATNNQFPDAPNASSADATQLAASAQDLTKEELIGRWTLAADNQTCDIFLSLTKWTGGYRAASRGCSGQSAVISAWDVQGKQVVLSDSTGTNVARLYKTASERYSGSLTTGGTVGMSR